jgi:hypothetical protein
MKTRANPFGLARAAESSYLMVGLAERGAVAYPPHPYRGPTPHPFSQAHPPRYVNSELAR